MSLETISRYFLLSFFMAFLLYESVCLRELLLSSFDRGGELHKKKEKCSLAQNISEPQRVTRPNDAPGCPDEFSLKCFAALWGPSAKHAAGDVTLRVCEEAPQCCRCAACEV